MKEEYSNDLEKLLSMAEKISETVNDLHTNITNIRAMFLFSVTGVYASVSLLIFLFTKPVWVQEISLSFLISLVFVAAILSFAGAYFIYQYVNKMKRYRRDLNIEIEMLHKLLSMVNEYKEHIHSEDLSYVENAVLEMRLQRIKYSGKW